MIRTNLAGKSILVTGATGFLGTALVERLLRAVPDCTVTVLVRPGQKQSAAERTRREIVKNDCFSILRQSLGNEFDQVIGERLKTVAGDVSQDSLGLSPEDTVELSRCDTVIHSAASVSFDALLDQAVEVNLLGPKRVVEAIESVAHLRKDLGLNPTHLISVSTAYVSGGHRGEAKEVLPHEAPYALDLDWKKEVASARRIRSDFEAQSRTKNYMERFEKDAIRAIGAAGRPLIASKAESLRQDFIKKSMIEAGFARAKMLGWPDAYAYTKSLGERALIESRGSTPLTILRPSIIESSLREPFSGWIRGFRMAEPVIISYGRGLLKEFPGVPEGTVDVIPVDLVVAALIAVAARGPIENGPDVIQVASGVRNPLKYRQLVDLVREWFLEHPLYDSKGQPIEVPEWSFPGRGRVQGQLQRTTKLLSTAERAVSSLPLRGKQASFVAQLEDKKTLAERALSYVELYGAYTETEAKFRIDNLLKLKETLEENDSDFVIDPKEIVWKSYIHDTHLPSIVKHSRVKDAPSKKSAKTRSDRTLSQVLNPTRQLAVFDLEHTLISSNVVEAYAWLATRHLDTKERIRESLKLIANSASLLKQDRKDRSDFLRSFYRRYEGAPIDQLQKDSLEMLHHLLLNRSYPEGIARVRKHRALGHKTLLITGALDFIVEPLKPLFDDVICASMEVDSKGLLTGELLSLPPTGEARALLMEDYTKRHSLDLEETVAYADSASDLAMLERAAFQVAVNPEAKLAAIARRRGWHVEHWHKTKGAASRVLPLGPLAYPVTTSPLKGASKSLGVASLSFSKQIMKALGDRK